MQKYTHAQVYNNTSTQVHKHKYTTKTAVMNEDCLPIYTDNQWWGKCNKGNQGVSSLRRVNKNEQ